MFSTSRAKPKKFCACLLTQRLPVSPGVCVQMTKGTGVPDVGSRESGGMLPSGRARDPLFLRKDVYCTRWFFFLLLLLVCSSRRVLFQGALDSIFSFLLHMRSVSKSARASYPPGFVRKRKGNDIRAARAHHRLVFFFSAFRRFYQCDLIGDKT